MQWGVSISSGNCPPSTSVIALPEPLYGTWKIWSLERSLSSSMTRRALVLGVAMSAERGSLLSALTRSPMDRIGDLAFTTSTIGKLPVRTIGSKSFSVLMRWPA